MFLLPWVMSYVSILKQQNAAAAAAGLQSVMFIMGGTFIQITRPAIAAMGLGHWVTLMVAACLAVAGASSYLTWRELSTAAAAAQRAATVNGAGQGRRRADEEAPPAVVVQADKRRARALFCDEGGLEGAGTSTTPSVGVCPCNERAHKHPLFITLPPLAHSHSNGIGYVFTWKLSVELRSLNQQISRIKKS
jgi:hypothetical protein